MTADNLKVIKDALYLLACEENEAIERAIESCPKPSESLYQKCDEIVNNLLTKQEHEVTLRKIITILIASTIIISLMAITAVANRDKIGGFFADFFEKYIEFSIPNNDEPLTSPSNVSVTYIPEGFTETRRDIGEINGLLGWSKNDSIIIIRFKCVMNGAHTIDNENSNYRLIEIGDITLYRTEKNGQVNATWTDNKMIYTLSAIDVEWDEMVKIIEGIKIEE